MKKIILLFIFAFPFGIASAQCSGDECGGDRDHVINNSNTYKAKPQINFTIFPNPTIDYFQIDKTDNLKEIRVYDMSGRQHKQFIAGKDQTYHLAELTHGVYLVRFIDFKNKVLQTKQIQILDSNSSR